MQSYLVGRRRFLSWLCSGTLAAQAWQTFHLAYGTGREEQLRLANRIFTREGAILDRNGVPLTAADGEEGEAAPLLYDSVTRLVGYRNPLRGKSGLRNVYNTPLYEANGPHQRGRTLNLTLDIAVNEAAQAQLDESDCEVGAVVVMNAETGALINIASKSSPPFDANALCDATQEEFEVYDGIDGFWQNPAIAAAYPQGSTMKLATANLMLKNNVPLNYYDTGEENGSHNSSGAQYGWLDLKKAFYHSVNTYFCHGFLAAGTEAAAENLADFGYGQPLQLTEADEKTTPLYDPAGMENGKVGFGYSTKASPLQVAMQYSALWDGNIRHPYLLESITDADGTPLEQVQPEIVSSPIAAEHLPTLREALSATAQKYGVKADGFSEVYAKTGTYSDSAGRTIWLAGMVVSAATGAPYAFCIMNHGSADFKASSTSLAKNINPILQAMAAQDL